MIVWISCPQRILFVSFFVWEMSKELLARLTKWHRGRKMYSSIRVKTEKQYITHQRFR